MRSEITVLGMVQGVGFRPFVAKLAESMKISGTVRNSGGIVIIECEAETGVLGEFVRRLRFLAPRGSQILDIKVRNLGEDTGDAEIAAADTFVKKDAQENCSDFQIIRSDDDTAAHVPILPPDIGMCPDCRAELLEKSDRRYDYPFISCTLCGPRYSILEQIPYDREHITMRHFEMCPQCKKEYLGKGDRRRHAQTISCHDCGPQLLLIENTGENLPEAVNQSGSMKLSETVNWSGSVKHSKTAGQQALQKCIQILKRGGVLAVKGIGGYQLCCSPFQADAVDRIRVLKQREKKPFAVMFENVEQIRQYCMVNEKEAELLESPAAPIVLLAKAEQRKLAGNVCGESHEIGAFLPYTGLHLLLIQACGPLVMTSANITAEPIITSEERMLEFAASKDGQENIDGIAYHTREILTPLDDSLCRVVDGKPFFLRRSRGYVPLPLLLSNGRNLLKKQESLKEQESLREQENLKKQDVSKPQHIVTLACDGDLKSVFALSAEGRSYLSQYFGDLIHFSVEQEYERNIRRMEELLQISRKQIICDRHPGYISHQFAEKEAARLQIPLIQVQHHHAHIASVMAEHGLSDCIGVAMDGTGYGLDGTVWGCEFLECRGAGFRRRGHLSTTELVGGDTSAKDANLIAAVQLMQLNAKSEQTKRQIQTMVEQLIPEASRANMAKAAIKHHINTSQSSSMGRLFDTISALLGICGQNGYEGECASALENVASLASIRETWCTFPIVESKEQDQKMLIAQRDAFLLDFLQQMTQKSAKVTDLAFVFHEAVAQMILDMCNAVRLDTKQNKVALSGGVFANMLLWSRTVSLLRKSGFEVFWNEKVPSNDGGIAFGQAWIVQQLIEDGTLPIQPYFL